MPEIQPCSREDWILHGLPHTVLSRTRPRFPTGNLWQCEDLNQSYPGPIHASHDSGVHSRWERGNDRGFFRITWSKTAALNLCDLAGCDDATNLCGLPIVVRCDRRASLVVVQLQYWIGQGVANIKRWRGERRSGRPHQDLLR